MEKEKTGEQATSLGHLKTYPCYRDGKVLTAKVISRDMIGYQAKRKNYVKWNSQVKQLTSSYNHLNILPTIEVVRAKDVYILIQERDPNTTVSLAEFIKERVTETDPKKQKKFFTLIQLQQMIMQIVNAF